MKTILLLLLMSSGLVTAAQNRTQAMILKNGNQVPIDSGFHLQGTWIYLNKPDVSGQQTALEKTGNNNPASSTNKRSTPAVLLKRNSGIDNDVIITSKETWVVREGNPGSDNTGRIKDQPAILHPAITLKVPAGMVIDTSRLRTGIWVIYK
jgi:hypothetical protein